MIKRQIICKFFRLWLFCAVISAVPVSAADIPVASRLRLSHDLSGRDAAFLRDAVRQLDRLRRIGNIKLENRTMLVIPGNDKILYQRNVLYLPGDAALWNRDFRLRCQIYTVLAAHRLVIDCPAEPPPAAAWVGRGLDAAANAAASMGKYFTGNMTYPYLAAYYCAAGKLPDYTALCRSEIIHTPVAGEIAAEQSRMLLDIFARNGRLRDLFAGMTAGRKPDFWQEWYISPAHARKHLAADTAKLLWNRYSPLPPPEAVEKLPELQKFSLPEIDDAGKFTGKTLSVDFAALAQALDGERSDAAQIRQDCIKPWAALGELLTAAERRTVTRITDAIRMAGKDDDAPENFSTAVADLTGQLKSRQRMEQFLSSTLDQLSPPAIRLALPLEAAEFPEAVAATAAEQHFFSRALDQYVR